MSEIPPISSIVQSTFVEFFVVAYKKAPLSGTNRKVEESTKEASSGEVAPSWESLSRSRARVAEVVTALG